MKQIYEQIDDIIEDLLDREAHYAEKRLRSAHAKHAYQVAF